MANKEAAPFITCFFPPKPPIFPAMVASPRPSRSVMVYAICKKALHFIGVQHLAFRAIFLQAYTHASPLLAVRSQEIGSSFASLTVRATRTFASSLIWGEDTRAHKLRSSLSPPLPPQRGGISLHPTLKDTLRFLSTREQ